MTTPASDIKWTWSSSNGGVFGDSISTSWEAPAGFHLVKVRAISSNGWIAEAAVTFRVFATSEEENNGLGSNGDGTCYIFKREGQHAFETFPISR